MHVLSKASTRSAIGALLTAIGPCGALGCNAITGIDDLRFEPCATDFAAISMTPSTGGPGGSPFQDECPEGEALVGVRSGLNGSFVSGLVPICGEVRASEEYPYAIHASEGTPLLVVHGLTNSNGTEPRICPRDTMIVGFEGTTALFGENPVLWSLSLICAPIRVEGPPDAPSLSLGETTSTPSMGGPVEQGDAFAPILCPENQVARALHGQSGALIDALGLGCAEPSLACPAARNALE